MSLNFNTQPYYDDFDENKNFHKILFKPGVAVQARELTQAQSILQDQIGKFGKFVLSDGSQVTGGQYFIDTNTKSLNLRNVGSLSTDIENFTGLYIVGDSSKCVGLITSVDVINFYLTIKPITNAARNFTSGESLKLFVAKSSALNYTTNPSIASDYSAQLFDDAISTVFGIYGEQNSYQLQINSSSIELGDVITFGSSNIPQYIVVNIGANSTYTVDKKLQITYNNATATITKFASRTVMEVGISDGVYFTNNHFVKALAQTVIPNAKTQYPSCVIGFEVIESIVDFIDDTSLLDPAQGSYNYTAPGADRYKIYLQLVSKPITKHEEYSDIHSPNDYGIGDLTSAKFIELLRIKNGIVVRDNTDPKLGELENTLARQMYDHAGNFIVTPYTVSFQESNFTDLSTTINAEISAGKAYVFGYEFNATFPTHLTIDKARDTAQIQEYNTVAYYGNHITIDSVYGSVPNPSSGSRVELHSAPKGTVDANTRIGYAYIRNIQHVNTGEYYLNLYNISATQNDLANTKSVILTSGSNYSLASFSANVVQENAATTLVDPGFNKLLFELPYKNVSTLSNTSITLDVFDTISVSSNTVAIHTGSLTKAFPSGLSLNLSTDLKNNHFLVSTKTTNGFYTAGKYVDLTDVSIKTEQVGSEYVATLNFTKGYTGTIDIKYGLKYNSATKKTKTLVANHVSQVTTDVYPKSLTRADISQFKGVFKSTDIRATYIGAWNSSTTYNASDVVLYGEKLYVSSKNSNVGFSPDGASPNWNQLRDVTSRYILNNGQTDYMYDHGSITAKTSSDCGSVFVIFDYYTHSSSGEYISFDSYPVNYSEIPKTTINGIEYNLRDYVDFRPRRSDNSTSVSYDTYQIPSSDFTGFTFDMSYYLGRVDKLVLTKQKNFQWLKGNPSYSNYVPPADLVDAMTLATIQLNPFTAKESDIIVKYSKHRRYTMDDIGKLDTRIQNVEYYTSLNLVEKDVMSRNIIDSVTGSRMKNGFVVDPFVGYGVMSLTDNYKNISLDLSQQLARPSFATKYENVEIKDIGTLIQKQDLITFPYTESQVTLQFLPTGTTNINPFDTISYAGDLFLSPQADIWVDTENKPIINVLNDNAAAIRDASSVPGLLFDEWNAYYATHPYTELSGSVDVIYNNVDYKISTTKVVQSDIVTEVSNTVIPYARSIPITFKATHLSPLTKMYVYVNGRMVNAYVQPTTNPTGQITGITITNPGTGYDATTKLSLTAASTVTANASFEIYGSTVNGAELINNGVGYSTTVQLSPTITGTGANGTVNLSLAQPVAGDLYTNEAGECEGILNLPNDSLLRFPAGELLITICDTPNYDFDTYAMAKAQATFYSSGRYRVLQETITSIRQPYVKKVGTIVQPEPDSGCRIVTQSQVNYLTNHYARPYSNIKTGTLSLPVYLNVRPNSPVTVTFINASGDMSANASIAFDKTSLTFNSSNYATPQYITLSYDLGNRSTSGNNFIDNALPTYIEYYATSTDTNYNYIGTVQPIKSWLKDTVITGVATTKLFPYSVLDPDQVLPESTPYLTVSPIQTSVLNGKTFFTVTYGGGSEIGWWNLSSAATYPLTFTATSSNTSILKVQSSRYEHYDVVNDLGGAVRTVDKNDQEVLTFKYFLAANSAGMANVTVTTSSSNPHWNGLTAIATGIVSSSLSTANPSIIIHPNITTSPSTGTIIDGVRYTTETGGSHSIAVSLSKAPTQNVTISAISLDNTEGYISGKSEDGLSIVSGNTVTFTPTSWNSVKAIVVTGLQDYTQDGSVDYTVRLTSSSSDTTFNGLIANVPITNKDVLIPKGEVVATVIGTTHTNEKNGGQVKISVTLNKKPYASQVVTVTAVSSDETEGVVTTGGTLYFNENTWNIPQLVVVTGQEDIGFDGDYPYKIVFTSSTPTFSEFSDSTVEVNLVNDDYVYQTDLWISTDNSRSYSAIPLGRPSASWMPALSVSGATITTAWGVSAAHTPIVQIINTSKNSVTIQASAILGAQNYSDDGVLSGYALLRFTVSASNNDTLISRLATMPDVAYTYTRDTKTLDIAVWVYNHGGSGRFYRNFTISGLYYDAVGAGFKVTETLTTTTTTKVVRLDTYAVDSTSTTTTYPQQDVLWNTNPESHLAAYNTLTGYPLSSDPKERFPVADVNAAITSANTYRKNNIIQLIEKQKRLVDTITAKIAALSPNIPKSLDRSLTIETYNLTLLNIRLQTL